MLYVPSGAPSLGQKIPVLVRVPRAWGARAVVLRSVYDGDPLLATAEIDDGLQDGHEVWWRAELDVHNPVTSYRFLLDGGPDGCAWLNGSGVWAHDVTDAADFRVSTFPPPPGWLADAVIYQIFPDRFARAQGPLQGLPPWATAASWEDPVIRGGPDTLRQLYGGDLRGVEEHLDYLEKLGVNVVYLTPFFPAESNHRYNASTFDHVDPLLGGDAALASLAASVHRRGMRLLGDLTTNHSGTTHDWFRRALDDPGHDRRGASRRAAAGRARLRCQRRPPGGRLARHHELQRLHPAGLHLAEAARRGHPLRPARLGAQPHRRPGRALDAGVRRGRALARPRGERQSARLARHRPHPHRRRLRRPRRCRGGPALHLSGHAHAVHGRRARPAGRRRRAGPDPDALGRPRPLRRSPRR